MAGYDRWSKISRREFARTAAAAGIAVGNVSIGARAAFAKSSSPALFLYDKRFAASRRLAVLASSTGTSAKGYHGDLTASWRDEMVPLLRDPVRYTTIEGSSTAAGFRCIQLLVPEFRRSLRVLDTYDERGTTLLHWRLEPHSRERLV